MKLITLSVATCLLIALYACKTSQKTSGTASATPAPALTPEATLTADVSAAADKRYPSVAKADIANGEKLYKGKCGNCHGLPDVTDRSEEKWPGTIKWMAPKAQLNEIEQQQVLQYVLCARDVKMAGK